MEFPHTLDEKLKMYIINSFTEILHINKPTQFLTHNIMNDNENLEKKGDTAEDTKKLIDSSEFLKEKISPVLVEVGQSILGNKNIEKELQEKLYVIHNNILAHICRTVMDEPFVDQEKLIKYINNYEWLYPGVTVQLELKNRETVQEIHVLSKYLQEIYDKLIEAIKPQNQ